MKTLIFFAAVLLGLFFANPPSAVAQSECSCQTYGVCSASQSCPTGFIAVCTCTAASCGSSCQKAGDEGNENFSG